MESQTVSRPELTSAEQEDTTYVPRLSDAEQKEVDEMRQNPLMAEMMHRYVVVRANQLPHLRGLRDTRKLTAMVTMTRKIPVRSVPRNIPRGSPKR